MIRWERTSQLRTGSVFDVEVIDERPGLAIVEVSGVGAHELFKRESGGHRWQRIPPTEKRGRVQTSTVTVAVFAVTESATDGFNLKDVEFTTTKGSGPGGQNRNKVETCVIATHKPTGFSVRVCNSRSQHKNKETATDLLRMRVINQFEQVESQKVDVSRKEQVGSGMRGDKIRTYRTKDDTVKDHRTGKTQRLSSWQRCEW